MGRLFTLNNKAYVVTGVTSPLTTETGTTLAAAGTWSKGATLTDASGNTYYCDSVGLYATTLVFKSAATGKYQEFTGNPVMITGNVISDYDAASTARFSAPAYIGGNVTNGSGTMFFAGNSTIGGTFTNGGTITSTAADLEVGSLVNNGTVSIGTRQLTLNGNLSGNAIDFSNAYLKFTGSTNRIITGILNDTIKTLRLNNTGTLSLGNQTKIGELSLTTGTLAIGDFNLSPNLLSGGGSDSYVITNGTGKLILNTADGTAKLFPVGISSTSYDPVTITPVTGTATSVKVSANLSGSAVYGVKYNQVEWDITPTVASSTILALTPSVIDNLVATRSAGSVIGHYVDGSYVNNNSVTLTDGTYTGTFDTFSPFVTGANIDLTGIENQKQFTVYTQAGSIIINGTSANDQITIYNMNGQMVSNVKVNGQQTAIHLQPGVYVVRVNASITKVTI